MRSFVGCLCSLLSEFNSHNVRKGGKGTTPAFAAAERKSGGAKVFLVLLSYGLWSLSNNMYILTILGKEIE